MKQPANESNANRPGEFIPHRGTIDAGEVPEPPSPQDPVFHSYRTEPIGHETFANLGAKHTPTDQEVIIAHQAQVIEHLEKRNAKLRDQRDAAEEKLTEYIKLTSPAVSVPHTTGEPDWQLLALEERIDRGLKRPVPVHDFVAPKADDPRNFAIAPEADLSDFVPPTIPAWMYPLLGALVLVIGWLATATVLTP